MTEPPGGAAVSPLEEERDYLLGSLRDLEAERAAGDIDDADYQSLHADYTARAATVIRRLAGEETPAPAATPASGAAVAPPGRAGRPPRRVGRAGARRWAVVGLVAVAAAGVLGWSIHRGSSARPAGGVATGDATPTEHIAALVLAAQEATAKGDGVTALRDLDNALAIDPNQVDALAARGWLLAQTERSSLVTQGVADMTRAQALDATYAPVHAYLGATYLYEKHYGPAITELQWYLSHRPDPALEARVQAALAQAEAAEGAQKKG